jgi:hypothetical protein
MHFSAECLTTFFRQLNKERERTRHNFSSVLTFSNLFDTLKHSGHYIYIYNILILRILTFFPQSNFLFCDNKTH